MANNVRIGVSAPGAKGASSEIDQLRDRFAKMQAQGAKGFAIGAGAAVTERAINGVTGAADFAVHAFGSMVEAASDLNESTSKSAVIFGKASGAMEDFAEGAADALGLSKQAALEAGASFGNFFTGIGQSQQAAESMSEKMVTLAGDLASFNNLDPTEVLDKLRSGLTGEAEPLRSVGVFLTEAKVKAMGMQMGLADAHGEMSEGAKVMARYKIILNETKTAQGDFARTADGLANSQRKLNAELVNAQADFGKYLLPVQLEATKGLVGLLKQVDAAPAAFEAMRGSTADQAQAMADFGAMIPFVGDKVKSLGETILSSQKQIADGSVTGKFADDWATAEREVSDSMADVATASIDMRDEVVKSMRDSAQAAEDNEKRTTAALKGVIDNAFDPLIEAAQIAATQREIAEQDQIIASKDSTKEQIADAQLRRLELQKTLQEQNADLAEYGSEAQRIAYLNSQLTSQAIVDGLASTDPQRRKAAQEAVAAIELELQGFQDRAHGYGFATGSAYTHGITDALDSEITSVTGAFKQYEGLFYASSPPGPKSPLHFIDKWGRRTGEAWSGALAKGMMAGLPDVTAAAAGVAQGIPFGGSPGNSAFGLAGGNGGGAGLTITGGIHLHGIGSDVSPAAAQGFADELLHRIGNGVREEGARFTRRQRVGARV